MISAARAAVGTSRAAIFRSAAPVADHAAIPTAGRGHARERHAIRRDANVGAGRRSAGAAVRALTAIEHPSASVADLPAEAKPHRIARARLARRIDAQTVATHLSPSARRAVERSPATVADDAAELPLHTRVRRLTGERFAARSADADVAFATPIAERRAIATAPNAAAPVADVAAISTAGYFARHETGVVPVVARSAIDRRNGPAASASGCVGLPDDHASGTACAASPAAATSFPRSWRLRRATHRKH